MLPWQVPPPNPYASAEDEFPTGSPYAVPVDPAAVAAEHQAAGEPAAPARGGGAHRTRRSPWRYVLPALLGAVVVVAIGIGLAGWIGNTNDDNLTGTAGSQVHVSAPQTTATASSPAASATPTRSSTPTPSASKKPTPKPSRSAATPVAPPVVHAPLVVLNETTEQGLAARVAEHLRELGWTVTGVGNWRGNIDTSTVYYPTGELAAARRLEYDLGLSRIRPRVAGMLTDRLTVVLTSDPLN